MSDNRKDKQMQYENYARHIDMPGMMRRNFTGITMEKTEKQPFPNLKPSKTTGTTLTTMAA